MKKHIFIFIGTGALMSCSPYKKIESFKSYHGHVHQILHKESGAYLVLIKNKDPARGFSAIFKTPPYDDTGLFHIFEHAVLQGSRLYPSKSLFNKVSDSSLASFVNALTFSDSTAYPFVTRHSKDFDNLLSVYMDAVFFPKARNEPKIIKREGWHYEVHPETKKMSLNGIVFNEMKGSFVSPMSHLWRHLSLMLLPQTPYAYVAGGLPEKIAELSFEQIVSAHKKYYHPQNSLIVLYGDIDFHKALSTIHKKFLSFFKKDKNFKSPEIPLQKESSHYAHPPVITAYYPGTKGPNKTFLAKGYVLGELPYYDELALSVLMEAFSNHPASPLKVRLSKEGLSVSYHKLPGKDNGYAFVFRGGESSKINQIENILLQEIEKAVHNGLPSELLNSVLNRVEFRFREAHNKSERSFILGLKIKDHWLYPQKISLAETLDDFSRLKKVREILESKNFVKLSFQKGFKENTRFRWLVLEPDPQFSQKFNQTIQKQVASALKQKPLRAYEREDKLFREWKSAKEPPEIIDKTPVLELSDIKEDEVKPIPFHHSQMESYNIIEYPQKTNGISYLRLFFDLRGVKEDNLKNLKIFSKLIGKTDTDNYSFPELSQKMGDYIGRVDFQTRVYQSAQKPEHFKPLMRVSLSFLNENREKSLSLLKELLLNSRFTPKDQVQSLLNRMKADIVSDMSWEAYDLAKLSAKRSFFPFQGAFLNETHGGSFFKYVLKKSINTDRLVGELNSLLENIFNQERLYLITLTADPQELTTLKQEGVKLKKALPKKASKNQEWLFSHQEKYLAYAIPSEVQFLSEVMSFRDQGLKYSGHLWVYSQYVNSHFMWPRFREESGAYGAWTSPSRNGLWTMGTYRDPHLKKSWKAFSELVDFMKNEELSQEKLKPSIIGALKDFYADRSPYEKADLMSSLYLMDMTWEDRTLTMKEILQTQIEDFDPINQALSKAFETSKKSVSGSLKKIKKESPDFKKILILS